MSRSIYLFLGCFVLSAIVIVSSRHALPEQNGKTELSDYMQVKLKYAQEILKGLALEDFDAIAKNAQQLSMLSRGASWNVIQTEDYLQHSSEFRRAADALRDAAKKKNIDGAALAYMETTMKCVNCHKYVRDSRVANVKLRNDGKKEAKEK